MSPLVPGPYSSSFVVLIFNNLNISTITSGENTNKITSKIFSFGNTTILKTSLKAGINKIANINKAEPAIANNSFVLFKIPVLELKKKKMKQRDIIQLDQSHTDNKWVESIIKLQKLGYKIYSTMLCCLQFRF